jgi:hypothetical protein
VYSRDSQTETGLTPPLKYAAAGEAITVYWYSDEGRFTPSPR